MTRSFIALGSNLDDPLQQVIRAVESIRQLPKTTVTTVSRWYRSKAIGPGKQPDYINGVIEISTELNSSRLLITLQAIETAHKRVRAVRWGPRTLDLDILLYGDATVEKPELTIPHPRMLDRNFVLYPLFDVAPALILPTGKSLKSFIDNSAMDNLHLVDYP